MKWITIFITLFFISSIALASNLERIDELRAEAQQLLQEKQRALQVIANIDRRVAEISGAIQELQRLDNETKEDSKDGKSVSKSHSYCSYALMCA